MKRAIDSGDIEQLISGSQAAFSLVYDTYGAKVYGIAFRFLKDRELSEEIVQETFIKLWQSRNRLDPDGNLWLYIYVIAKRLSLNSLREISKSTTLFKTLVSRISELHNDTEEEVMVNDLEKFTQKIVEKLPKQQQLIFNLSRIEGLTHKEIADRLHISTNTVKNHMVEALKTIKADLRCSDIIFLMLLVLSL